MVRLTLTFPIKNGVWVFTSFSPAFRCRCQGGHPKQLCAVERGVQLSLQDDGQRQHGRP